MTDSRCVFFASSVLAIVLLGFGCVAPGSGRNARTGAEIRIAMTSHDEAALDTLLSNNINSLPRHYFTELIDEACKNGNTKAVSIMLKHHVEPSRSTLYFSAKAGNIEICKMLLDGVCDINEVDSETGRAGLFGAIHNGDSNIFDYFMQSGARTDIKDNLGSTPLMYAAVCGNEQAFMRLLNTPGLDLDTQDNHGNTAFMYCALRNKTEFMKAAITHHVKVDLVNHDELTALHLALSWYSYEAAFMLIRNQPPFPPTWSANTADEKYLTGVAALMQAEIAGNASWKTKALPIISAAVDGFQTELKETQHKIISENVKYVGLITLETLVEIGNYTTSTTTYKYSTPSGVYTQTFTIKNYSPALGGNVADYDDHAKAILTLTKRKIFLTKRIAICSLISQKGSAALTPDERKIALFNN